MEKSSNSKLKAKTILVVDDEFGLLEVLEFILSDLGFNVISALNGQEALERLKEVVPAVIILDLMMPIMDGAAVLKAIQDDSAQSRIPVILISALREQTVKERCSGYKFFLRKPFNTEKLLETIQKLLAANTPDSKPD
jgi:CheY-like chemotaxis protein